MKKEIHPEYYIDAVATCACGKKHTVGSVMKEIRVEICSECHPFYTGTEKIIDTAGRVEKFMKRRKVAEATPKKKKVKKVSSEEDKETEK